MSVDSVMSSARVFWASLFAVGCSGALGNDGFRDRLSAGCSTRSECTDLVHVAQEREAACRRRALGDCAKQAIDLRDADRLARQQEESERRAARDAHAANIETRYREEKQRHEEALRREQEARAEEQRRNEEAKRARQEAARAFDSFTLRRNAQLAEAMGQSRMAAPPMRLRVCQVEEEISRLREDLARERAIERHGGVADLAERRRIAERLHESEELLGKLRGHLAKHTSHPPRCNESWRSVLADCIAAIAVPEHAAEICSRGFCVRKDDGSGGAPDYVGRYSNSASRACPDADTVTQAELFLRIEVE